MVKFKDLLLLMEPPEWIMALSGVVAVILSVFGFFGYWNLSVDELLKIVLAVCGFVILSLISTNHISKKILKNVASQDSKTYAVDYQDTLIADLRNAETIEFYGIEMAKSIDKYYSILEERAKAGKIIRFLFADPDGDVMKMVDKRYPSNTSSCPQKIKDAINLIHAFQKSSDRKVEIKIMDYLFHRKAFIINRELNNGVMYISNYTFRMAGEKSKHYYRKGEGNYFKFYSDEFLLMWKASEELK